MILVHELGWENDKKLKNVTHQQSRTHVSLFLLKSKKTSKS